MNRSNVVFRAAVTLAFWASVSPRGLILAQKLDSPPDRIKAPELTGGGAWLNTDKPLTLEQLRGRVILLDFWTYCCINCMHVFPDLKYLETKYKDQPFVVVGVHSGKFEAEKDSKNIRQAILRHNIEHPVIVDSDYTVWNAFGVSAWPTLVLINPEGFIVGSYAGEGHRKSLDQAIGGLLERHRSKGTLAAPMKFALERQWIKTGVLHFPGKVLADAASKRLFISDTNHHRVLISDLDGRVQKVIGDGNIGLVDGPPEKARFHQPQGLALSADGTTLYVADTENHAVRAVTLASCAVSTIAGTGSQGQVLHEGAASSTELSSPWDLTLVGNMLYIAMAGSHQIGALDLAKQSFLLVAGTGQESRIDGPNRSAAFAQPSGLATDGKTLFVADSEISTIRSLELGNDGKTATVAGSGGLFEFGHKDGVREKARFQHPLGVALRGRELYVADTFNHRIRRIDLDSGAVTTWLGTGKTEPGAGGDTSLFEPGGLSIAGDTLYIADTNNHRILAVDLKTKDVKMVTVVLPG